MSFLKNSAKSGDEEEVPFIGVIDPALDNFYRRVDATPPATRQTIGFGVIGATLAVSATFHFIKAIPNFVHVAVGVPLGIALLFVIFAFMHIRDTEAKAKDPSYVPLKDRNSPSQRMRYGIGALVVFIIVSLTIKDYIPYVLGGILAINAVASIYNYIRRTPEEIEREARGEPDPRDEVNEDDEEVAPEVLAEETKEYIALLDSLPEDQRKILLNPKLNGALTVIDDDDIKSTKKRKLFRK